MYGDKTSNEYIKAGNNHLKVNVEYYITERQFKNMYFEEKKTLKEIANIVGFKMSVDNFKKLVNQKGWRDPSGKQTYKVNKDFFEEWNRESAWVYGWLLTDGYVRDRINLQLHTKDIDVLEKIKAMIDYEGKILTNRTRNTSQLIISNRKLINDLHEKGMPKTNKTFSCTFPDIPKKYYFDFIRGAFEGDGTIHFESSNSIRLSICGASTDFMEAIQDVLMENGIETSKYVRKDSLVVLRTKNMHSALRWAYFMYSNTTEDMRLNRKFDKYAGFIRNFYNTRRNSEEAIALVELARKNIPECSEDSCAPFLVPKRKAA